MHFSSFVSLAVVLGGVAADTTTTIVASSNRGTWEGWGTSLAWWARKFGNRDDLANIFFSTSSVSWNGQTLPGLGFTIARHNAGASSWNTINGTLKMVVSPNMILSRQIEGHWLDWTSKEPSSSSWTWTVDANQRAMLQKAKARGANIFELFSNSPMWWQLANSNPSGSASGGNNLQTWNYPDHAVYMAVVAKYYKDNFGITFTSVDPFNEPIADWWKANGTQEGCHIDVAAQASIIGSLRTELNNRGLSSTIISASDESTNDMAVSTFNSLGSTALGQVGRINVHGYQYGSGRRDTLYSLASGAGKKLWNSEYGEGDATGVQLVSNLLLDFRWLLPTAWVYWQALDGGGWGLIDADNESGRLGSANQKLFALANFARHIRPGYRILDGGSDNTVAAWDSSSRKLVIVAVNWGSAQYLNFELSAFATRPANGTVVQRWSTILGSGEQYKQYSDTTISGTKFWSNFATNQLQTFEVTGIAP